MNIIYEDDIEETITPNHLLYGRKLPFVNAKESTEILDENNYVGHLQQVIDHFWKRWQFEYLLLLRQYKEKVNKTVKFIPSVGDINIVYEEHQPRQNWMLGKICEIIYSKGKNIRGAKVLLGKTKNIIERPINKLFPLESNNESQPSNTSYNGRVRRNAAMMADLKIKYH